MGVLSRYLTVGAGAALAGLGLGGIAWTGPRRAGSFGPPTSRRRAIPPSRPSSTWTNWWRNAPKGGTASGFSTPGSSARKARPSRKRGVGAIDLNRINVAAIGDDAPALEHPGATFPVPLDRPPLQGDRRADRRRHPGGDRAQRFHRAHLLRFRGALDLYALAAGPQLGGSPGPENSACSSPIW